MRGRKKKPEGQVHDILFRVKLTKGELFMLEELAELEKESKSHILRKALLNYYLNVKHGV